MSTRTPATSTSTDSRPNPSAAFTELVFANAEICSECFSRIKRVEYIDVAHGTLGTRTQRFDERVEAGVRGHGEIKDGVFAPRTFCEECGSQSGRAYSDTLSQREAVERAHTLVDRLHEARFDVDRRFLVELVREAKTHDTIQGRDRELFERATERAILRTG